MWWLLACTWFNPDPSATPTERLDAVLPGLGEVVARYTEDAGPVADLVEATDSDLVRLLLPEVVGPFADRLGESPEVELRSAWVSLDGTVVEGEVAGEGAPAVFLDVRGGPAPDLRLDFDEGVWLSAGEMPPRRIPGEVSGYAGGVRFRVDLGPEVERGHVGGATAAVVGPGATDFGPAGVLGDAEPHAVALLVALADLADDADLTVAVALAYAPWRAHVADRAVVEADARDRVGYGLAIDAWLERKGVDWRLATASPLEKLLWAVPGGEAQVYSALPLGSATEALSLEAYRFHVPSAATLAMLRDGLPLEPTRGGTAVRRDEAIWADLDYRASDAGMAILCEARALPARTCFRWEVDRAGRNRLGPVDGRGIPLDLAPSVELQVDRWVEEGGFVGDCVTATTLALAAYQSVGMAPLGVGYAGPDWNWPTHNFPLWAESGRLHSPQGMPSQRWDVDATWGYVVVPLLDPYAGLTLGREPDGWSRGGAVAGGSVSYGEMRRWVEGGIGEAEVSAWVEVSAAGGWPELR